MSSVISLKLDSKSSSLSQSFTKTVPVIHILLYLLQTVYSPEIASSAYLVLSQQIDKRVYIRTDAGIFNGDCSILFLDFNPILFAIIMV